MNTNVSFIHYIYIRRKKKKKKKELRYKTSLQSKEFDEMLKVMVKLSIDTLFVYTGYENNMIWIKRYTKIN